jgi:Dolichyl-phosphate-mannose-protein mannosyltransferase
VSQQSAAILTPGDCAKGAGTAGIQTIRLRRFWKAIPRPLRAAAVHAVNGLCNPATGNRWAAALLLGYAALWTISATIRNLGVTLHGDMAEAFALSRDLSLGYFKHPPLLNWITAAWFAVMPIAQWAFFLLGCLNAALAMWAVWLAAGYVVDARRRILAVALLGLTPIFTFIPATFNHNTIQLSLWALVALSFLASIERTKLGWSILFGMACGLAMLAKYFAGVIVLACVLASFLHPNWRPYWRSARPYVAGAVCVAVLAPNLYWLISTDFVSIRYQVALQPHNNAATVIALTLLCLGAFAAYLAPALLAIRLCLRPVKGTWASTLLRAWPPRRAVVACIAFVPVVLPLGVFLIAGIGMPNAWIQPAYFFVPLAIICAPGLLIPRRAVTLIFGSSAALAVAAVIASPLLMVGNFFSDRVPPVEPFGPLARFATDAWHNRTGGPLEFVSGLRFAAWSVSFYSDDHPRVFPVFGVAPFDADVQNHWKEHGTLGICHSNDTGCNELFARALPDAQRLEITLPMTFLGMSRDAVSYVLYLMPGRAAPHGRGS